MCGVFRDEIKKKNDTALDSKTFRLICDEIEIFF